MPSSRSSRPQLALFLALLASGALHLSILLFAEQQPAAGSQRPPSRIEARLKPAATVVETPPIMAEPPAKPGKSRSRSRIIAVPQSPAPTWTAAQKSEMDSFLDELAKAPKPNLAQRSLAMAGEQERRLAARQEAEEALLELRPNAPPIDSFSLDAYLDGMVRRMNRSAAFVQRATGAPGLRSAAVQFRLNPDGSLKSFVVLNAGDQAEEIAYIRAVVQRSLPFSPFPPDLDRAARSLGITICIRPGTGGDGPGFTRMSGGRCR